MKLIRDNWAFLILSIVTFFLVIMLISLQSAIVDQQTGALPPDAGPFYAFRRQIAAWIAPATLTPTPTLATLTGASVALAAARTDTPTLTPLPTATALPPTPTATVLAAEPATETPLATETTAPPTATETPQPTDTVSPTPMNTSVPTETVTTAATSPPSPTPAAPAPRADFRLGYVERDDQCGLVSEIMRELITQQLDFTAETVAFPTTDDLFATLASTDAQRRVDLTVCYRDPDDRSYLQTHLGFVLLVGSAYRQVEGKNYLVLSNAAIKTTIQRDQPCLYRLLTKFRLPDTPGPDAAGWLADHAGEIADWTSCR
jgi:hypothetical protein